MALTSVNPRWTEPQSSEMNRCKCRNHLGKTKTREPEEIRATSSFGGGLIFAAHCGECKPWGVLHARIARKPCVTQMVADSAIRAKAMCVWCYWSGNLCTTLYCKASLTRDALFTVSLVTVMMWRHSKSPPAIYIVKFKRFKRLFTFGRKCIEFKKECHLYPGYC